MAGGGGSALGVGGGGGGGVSGASFCISCAALNFQLPDLRVAWETK